MKQQSRNENEAVRSKTKFSDKDDLEIKFKVEDKHDFITRDDMK